jgi:hypothetical protein
MAAASALCADARLATAALIVAPFQAYTTGAAKLIFLTVLGATESTKHETL